MCLFYFKNKADALYWGKTEGDGTKLTPSQSMVSGFSAACVGPLATGPMDVIKTRLQSQNRSAVGGAKYAGFLHALVTIPREEGVRALWKGMLPRLVRIPCGQSIVWAVSDQITGAFEARARAALTAK
jgi:solute carrier family 25 citrate transporter 1